MKLALLSVLLFLAVLHLQLDTVDSQCCNARGGRCGDGTRSTPCCGYRPCNLFCCACRGGCRRRGGKREVVSESQEDVQETGVDQAQEPEENPGEEDPFSKYDQDQDGRISLGEARRWLISGGCGNPFVKIMAVSNAFQEMDNDQDGGLDRQEIGG